MNQLVTVYIPSHKYGRFIEQAIRSVIDQSYEYWELIIIDDCSSDETSSIAAKYQLLYPKKIYVFRNEEKCGLPICANIALRASKGQYIMRLDADDYLDENALLVMTQYLEKNRDTALVYPNYVYIDEAGNFLAVENRKRIGKEVKLLDLPAHGACTLIRKRVLKSIGGYSEKFDVQDGYDLWLKILHRYPVGNVTTPLFYYRQHDNSQSKNEKKILNTRAQIKRERVESLNGAVKPSVVAVIGAKNTYTHMPDVVFTKFGGKALIDYTLESVVEAKIFDKIIISTDDPAVEKYCSDYDERVATFLRSPQLSGETVKTTQIADDAVIHFEKEHNFFPDIIVYLNVHSPLRDSAHIQRAVDTLVLYNTDIVISVYDDYDLHYVHGENGLKPLLQNRHDQIRTERDALYVNNGAIRVSWRDTLTRDDTANMKVGHIIMTKNESLQIKNNTDIDLLKKVLSHDQDPAKSLDNLKRR